MNIVREIKAKSTLGMALIKNLIVRPLRGSSAADWLGHLAVDDLVPAAPEVWQRIETTSRCIACGLCDVVESSPEPSSGMVMAAARRSQDAPVVLGAARSLAQHAEEIAKICPTGVSVEEVARWIEANAAALARARTRSEERGGS